MLNNRQVGRRRGRGNQRPQGNNGGRGAEQGNRIDNRARGNAPQMLEKYSTLARDAQQQGDRVMAEYYLQFADHYFRVVADNRARMEENRPRREEGDRDEGDRIENGRDDWQAEDGNMSEGEDRADADQDRYQNADRQQQSRPQRDRGDQGRPPQNRDSQNRDAPRRGDYRRDEGAAAPRSVEPREAREPREPRPPREPRFEMVDQSEVSAQSVQRQVAMNEGGSMPRPRRVRAPRSEADSNGFDASILPPAILLSEPEEKPAPKPRTRAKRVVTEAAEG